MRITFIINNKKNSLLGLIRKIQDYCNKEGLKDAIVLSTLEKNHAVHLASRACGKGCDYLIAVGGDGTLHEVINGVMQSAVPSSEYPVIGVLPYGSGNDFVRTLGVRRSIDDLFKLIKADSIKPIDIGKIELKKTGEIRHFINIAGLGLGPDVVHRLEQSSSILGSAFNYFKNIILSFLNYQNKHVKCISEGWVWEDRLLQMAIANGKYFGHNICIAPDAKLDDGKFQVAIFGDLSIWDYLKNLPKLKGGTRIIHEEVSYHVASELLLESEDQCVIEADGEFVGMTPASITVLPQTIRFLMPI